MLVYLVLAIALMFYTPEFNLNFYVPISVVDKNFLRASKRNALLSEKFYFRKNILDGFFISSNSYLLLFFLDK